MSHLHTSPNSIEFEVSRKGLYEGKVAYIEKVLGRRDSGWSSSATLGDVASYLTSSQPFINTPISTQTLYITSTSVQDKPAGSGAKTIRISFLDAGGNKQTTTVTMNGTTPVNLGNGFSYIQYMEVATGNVAAGEINISSSSGVPTVATTFEQISTGTGRSLSARYMIPTGYTGYITEWSLSASATSMDGRLRATVFSEDRNLSDVHHFQDTAYISSNSNSNKSLPYLKCPAGSEVKISAIPGATSSGNRADGSFTLLLIQE